MCLTFARKCCQAARTRISASDPSSREATAEHPPQTLTQRAQFPRSTHLRAVDQLQGWITQKPEPLTDENPPASALSAFESVVFTCFAQHARDESCLGAMRYHRLAQGVIPPSADPLVCAQRQQRLLACTQSALDVAEWFALCLPVQGLLDSPADTWSGTHRSVRGHLLMWLYEACCLLELVEASSVQTDSAKQEADLCASRMAFLAVQHFPRSGPPPVAQWQPWLLKIRETLHAHAGSLDAVLLNHADMHAWEREWAVDSLISEPAFWEFLASFLATVGSRAALVPAANALLDVAAKPDDFPGAPRWLMLLSNRSACWKRSRIRDPKSAHGEPTRWPTSSPATTDDSPLWAQLMQASSSVTAPAQSILTASEEKLTEIDDTAHVEIGRSAVEPGDEVSAAASASPPQSPLTVASISQGCDASPLLRASGATELCESTDSVHASLRSSGDSKSSGLAEKPESCVRSVSSRGSQPRCESPGDARAHVIASLSELDSFILSDQDDFSEPREALEGEGVELFDAARADISHGSPGVSVLSRSAGDSSTWVLMNESSAALSSSAQVGAEDTLAGSFASDVFQSTVAPTRPDTAMTAATLNMSTVSAFSESLLNTTGSQLPSTIDMDQSASSSNMSSRLPLPRSPRPLSRGGRTSHHNQSRLHRSISLNAAGMGPSPHDVGRVDHASVDGRKGGVSVVDPAPIESLARLFDAQLEVFRAIAGAMGAPVSAIPERRAGLHGDEARLVRHESSHLHKFVEPSLAAGTPRLLQLHSATIASTEAAGEDAKKPESNPVCRLLRFSDRIEDRALIGGHGRAVQLLRLAVEHPRSESGASLETYSPSSARLRRRAERAATILPAPEALSPKVRATQRVSSGPSLVDQHRLPSSKAGRSVTLDTVAAETQPSVTDVCIQVEPESKPFWQVTQPVMLDEQVQTDVGISRGSQTIHVQRVESASGDSDSPLSVPITGPDYPSSGIKTATVDGKGDAGTVSPGAVEPSRNRSQRHGRGVWERIDLQTRPASNTRRRVHTIPVEALLPSCEPRMWQEPSMRGETLLSVNVDDPVLKALCDEDVGPLYPAAPEPVLVEPLGTAQGHDSAPIKKQTPAVPEGRDRVQRLLAEAADVLQRSRPRAAAVSSIHSQGGSQRRLPTCVQVGSERFSRPVEVPGEIQSLDLSISATSLPVGPRRMPGELAESTRHASDSANEWREDDRVDEVGRSSFTSSALMGEVQSDSTSSVDGRWDRTTTQEDALGHSLGARSWGGSTESSGTGPISNKRSWASKTVAEDAERARERLSMRERYMERRATDALRLAEQSLGQSSNEGSASFDWEQMKLALSIPTTGSTESVRGS
jgi:hypothetical protein